MRNVGTCAAIPRSASGAVSACGGRRERDVQAAESVRARVATRSAGADRLVVAVKPVMRVERRGRVILACLVVNRDVAGRAGEQAEA